VINLVKIIRYCQNSTKRKESRLFEIGQEEALAAVKVIMSGRLERGEFPDGQTKICETIRLEQELSAYFGVRHSLALSSGTASLISALAALKIGPGDEVLIPGYTFQATAMAPLAVGALPIICDVDSSLTICPDSVSININERTKAILVVHISGLPCDMNRICSIAKKNNLVVIEDTAQAFGGTYDGRLLGGFGDIGCFSFNQYKNITAGEGGALVTNSKDIYERAYIFHDAGSVFRNNNRLVSELPFSGVNYRISEIQAAILRVQLTKVNGWINALKKVRDRWREVFSLNKILKHIDLSDDSGGTAQFYFFCCEDKGQATNVRNALRAAGVNCFSPAEQERHIYTHWDFIFQKRGGHCDRLNPYNFSENRNIEYENGMCPLLDDLSERVIGITLSPFWNETAAQIRAETVLEVVRRIGL
jgi:dTDP-4-amino-4,6-dideoxygalactose transaminase